MKILFLSVPTGHGHHQTSTAMVSYFSSRGDVECRMLDVFENISPATAEALHKGYLFSTMRAPKFYGKFYNNADRRDVSKYSAVGVLVKTVLNKKLLRFLRSYNPDVIVATHIFSAIAMSYLRKKYAMRAKTIGVITDFTVHPFWEDVDIDYYVTASELLNFQALKKGLLLEKVLPTGIPIHEKFAQSVPKEEARKSLGIENKFTVLMMMGSMGYGRSTMDVVERLDRMRGDFQMITVCGNNKKLKKYIDHMPKNKTFINYGFTHEVPSLMDAADCIVTKPGGLSVSEALAKRLPLILLDPIPGQEDRNQEFLLNCGAAVALSDAYLVDEALYQFMNQPWRLDDIKRNMSQIRKPNAAKDFGAFILSLPLPAPLAGGGPLGAKLKKKRREQT
jgi:processive 1,2-diacylglycerol beta-glucosyltransferase